LSQPEIVYRYRSMNADDLDALANDYLYFSKVKDFNDPFEMMGRMKLDVPRPGPDWHNFTRMNEEFWQLPLAEVQRLMLHGKLEDMLDEQEKDWREAHEETYQTMRNEVLCCCFSAVNDHPLMWGHYGQGLRGVALGYGVPELKEAMGFDLEQFLCEVQYPDDDAFPVADYSPYLFLRQGTAAYEEAARKVFYARFCTKSAEWRYEREYRLLLNNFEQKQPYGEKALLEVVFGELIPEGRKRLIKTILAGRGVRFKEAVRSKTHYKIEIRDLA